MPELLSDSIRNDDEKNRPEAILTYNKLKTGVDSFDKLLSTYSVNCGTRQWTLAVFFWLLNAAVVKLRVVDIINDINNNSGSTHWSSFEKTQEVEFAEVKH